MIVSRTGDCEDIQRHLQKYGVRTNIIELECASESTQQNARFTAKLLREHGCKRVIIVTSWFHSRRALSCFRHYAPEIEFILGESGKLKAESRNRPADHFSFRNFSFSFHLMLDVQPPKP